VTNAALYLTRWRHARRRGLPGAISIAGGAMPAAALRRNAAQTTPLLPPLPAANRFGAALRAAPNNIGCTFACWDGGFRTAGVTSRQQT